MNSIKKQINVILELLKQKDLPKSLEKRLRSKLEFYYELLDDLESGLNKVQHELENL